MFSTNVKMYAIKTTYKPIFPKLVLLASTAAEMIKTNQDIISVKPAKAAREAERIVVGRATLEARVAIASTARPMVTGNGTTLLSEVKEVVVVTVVVLLVMQVVPEATRGAVHAVTQMPFAGRGRAGGQGLVR